MELVSGHKKLPAPKDSIDSKSWAKFKLGWATANETRTDRQVFHDDQKRFQNWRSN